MARVHIAVPARPAGTAFPSAPATGTLFFRTDRNIEYVYDGTRWLSTQLFHGEFNHTDGTLPISSAQTFRLRNPEFGRYAIWVERSSIAHYITSATPASNYFTMQIVHQLGGGSTNVGASINTAGATQNAWGAVAGTPNAEVPSTAAHIQATLSLTGSPGGFIVPGISYRLVG